MIFYLYSSLSLQRNYEPQSVIIHIHIFVNTDFILSNLLPYKRKSSPSHMRRHSHNKERNPKSTACRVKRNSSSVKEIRLKRFLIEQRKS